MLILSGGAMGADQLFGDLEGTTCIACSFQGHNAIEPTNGRVARLPQEKLESRTKEYLEVCKRLKKKPARDAFVRNLMLRNMYQISAGDKYKVGMVVAISEITSDMQNVSGGTGYAIARAILDKIDDVIVLNKSDCRFYRYDYDEDKFILLKYRIAIPNIVAGIGSRVIGNNHISLIRRCFKNKVISNGGI